MAAFRPPPLLLTKRLTSFLHLNLSPQTTALLLLTPDGKLLAYASNPPIPVATLRTHGTVAASLYAIHSNGVDPECIAAALAREAAHSTTRRASMARRGGGGGDGGPLAVTIQLESGNVLVIRTLKCGMLFVCIGPPADGGSWPQTQQQQQQQQQTQSQGVLQHHLQNPVAGGTTTPGGNNNNNNNNNNDNNDGSAAAAAAANGHSPSTSPPPSQPAPPAAAPPGHNVGSPSEAASILSAATGATTNTTGTSSSVLFGAGTAGVMATRRRAEELARWLDDKLGTLEVPDDGLRGAV